MTPEQERSFEAFVAAHRDSLLRQACLLAADRQAGEDLLQLVLLRAVRHCPRIGGQPAAYLRRALVTTAVDESRRRRWRELGTARLPEVGSAEPTAVVGDRDQLLRALRRLTARQRAVVVLRSYADLSELETATELGISVGTVKSTASRALSALRTALPDPEGQR